MSQQTNDRAANLYRLEKRLYAARMKTLALAFNAKQAGRPGEAAYLTDVADRIADQTDRLKLIRQDESLPITPRGQLDAQGVSLNGAGHAR